MKDNPNLVDTTDAIARALQHGFKMLGNGDAATPMGAIEAHGKAILDSAKLIADALHDVADAIREQQPNTTTAHKTT